MSVQRYNTDNSKQIRRKRKAYSPFYYNKKLYEEKLLKIYGFQTFGTCLDRTKYHIIVNLLCKRLSPKNPIHAYECALRQYKNLNGQLTRKIYPMREVELSDIVLKLSVLYPDKSVRELEMELEEGYRDIRKMLRIFIPQLEARFEALRTQSSTQTQQQSKPNEPK